MIVTLTKVHELVLDVLSVYPHMLAENLFVLLILMEFFIAFTTKVCLVIDTVVNALCDRLVAELAVLTVANVLHIAGLRNRDPARDLVLQTAPLLIEYSVEMGDEVCTPLAWLLILVNIDRVVFRTVQFLFQIDFI